MLKETYNKSTRRGILKSIPAAGLILVAVGGVCGLAIAAGYPDRDVTFVVQSSPGGGSDIFARTLATTLKDLNLIPRPLVIENRPGGSGAVAYTYISARKGQPYFFGTGGGNFYTTPLLGQSPVNLTNFTPIAVLAADPYIMAVRADSPIKTLDDLKTRKTLVVGSTGVATDPRFLALMLQKQVKGLETRVVPFDGDGEVTTALLGGHIDVQFGNPSEILPQIKAGKLRPVAVTASERMSSLPDVPTFKELGINIDLSTKRGLFMPADLPPEAIAFWDETLSKLAASDVWKKNYVERFNLVPFFMKSKDYAQHMKETNEMYASMMRELGLIKQ